MFGQFLPVCVRGVVPGFVGWAVALGAGEADGSGLAAETTAAPPTRASPAARARVATPRLQPPVVAVGGIDASGPGVAGSSYQSIGHSCCRRVDWDYLD
jgi:hypothetical protein